MKTLLTLLAAAGLVAGAALAQSASPAATAAASPEMKRLDVWYGDWTYVGEYHPTPLGEAAKFTGTMSGRPTHNGNVAEFINREKGPAGETEALELCWFDPSTKKFAYVYLGNDGYIEHGPFTMTTDLCSWEGTGVAGGIAFKIKGTETVSPDQQILTRKTELSMDGKTWLPFFESKFTKAKAAHAVDDAVSGVEKSAVIAVIEEEKNAYLALDENRMAAVWAQQPTSAKVYVFDGKETRYDGYAAIAAHDREGLAREKARASAQRSRFEFSNTRVALQGDSAWLTCNARWEGLVDGQPAGATQARTYVLHKEKGLWKIALMVISQLATETPSVSASSTTEKELIQLENEWARAYVARDLKTLDRMEADDWACTLADGKVVTKAQEHAEVSSGVYSATEFVMSDLKVRVHGDTAVVTGRQKEVATQGGKDASAEFQITDTWFRRDGKWRCLATHLSKIAPTPEVPPKGASTGAQTE